MAVPSSGELRLYADIGVELGVPQSNVSLGSMSDSAGFAEPDAMSDFYGYVDALAPSVTTNATSHLAATSFRANGNVTSDGGGTITERGFYVGTNSSSPTNNTKYTVSPPITGSYSRTISGLSSNSTYYCWAFATNSVGTTYGSRVSATTLVPYVPTWSSGSGQQTVYNLNETYSGNFSGNIYYRNPQTGGYVLYKTANHFMYEFSGDNFSFGSGYNKTSAATFGGSFALPDNTYFRHVGTFTQNGGGHIVGYPTTGEGTALHLNLSGSGITFSNFSYSKTSWTYVRYNQVSSSGIQNFQTESPGDLVNRGVSITQTITIYCG